MGWKASKHLTEKGRIPWAPHQRGHIVCHKTACFLCLYVFSLSCQFTFALHEADPQRDTRRYHLLQPVLHHEALQTGLTGARALWVCSCHCLHYLAKMPRKVYHGCGFLSLCDVRWGHSGPHLHSTLIPVLVFNSLHALLSFLCVCCHSFPVSLFLRGSSLFYNLYIELSFVLTSLHKDFCRKHQLPPNSCKVSVAKHSRHTSCEMIAGISKTVLLFCYHNIWLRVPVLRAREMCCRTPLRMRANSSLPQSTQPESSSASMQGSTNWLKTSVCNKQRR